MKPIRKLSPIEQGFTISNDAYPLCVVCVLHLESGPTPEELEQAMAKLQQRHPLLQAGISKIKAKMWFTPLNPLPPLPLKIVEPTLTSNYRTITEEALNSGLNKNGPLMKCYYLFSSKEKASELIVCFHHSIVDGVAARLLLHELLSLCGRLNLPAAPPLIIPEFPIRYQGLSLKKRILAFSGRQMKAEWAYQKNGTFSPIPKQSINATIGFSLSPESSRKLSVRIGRAGLSLNSVLLAAITLALIRHRHGGKDSSLVRALSFANLRSALIPALEQQELGCYISMLRLTVPIHKEQTELELAKHIRNSIYQSSRKGEIFLMSILSKYLVKMALSLGKIRLGVSALSFIGKLDLNPQYGAIQLKNVEAYISNNRYGPEFSAFGKILFGRIGLDFTYLPEEISTEQAQQMVNEIQQNLENIANKS